MTSVNMPRDDAVLKIDPKAPTNRNVKEVEPYPAVQPVQKHEEATQAPSAGTPRPQRRRGKDRRQRNEKVLLDTRSGPNRRRMGEDDSADENGEDAAGQNIDVYI